MELIKKEIHIEKAGTLKNLLTKYEKNYVSHLKISGFLNSKDFDVLDDMCTSEGEFDDDDNYTINFEEPPFLTVLDLGESSIIDYPYLGEFTYHPKLEKFVCPKNLEGTSNIEVFKDSEFLKTVVIPETFREFGVGTFMNCECLEEINFPNKLERIGSFSFCNCTSLRNVKIPANVSIIESAAFGGCYKLEKFEIVESNPHFTVADGVLFNKDKTKLIALPCGFKSKHYAVPEGVKVIGDGSFLNSQIESITFPSSLQVIEDWAFRGCNKLKSIDIPDSVTEIGVGAFEFCSGLEKVKLPNQLTRLKFLTFSGSSLLKEIDIPTSVKSISNAIGGIDGIEIIHLHNGLETLNDFTHCESLKNIVIPKTVKEIASGIFRKSIYMHEIKLDKENPNFCVLEGSLYSKDKTKMIVIPYNEKNTFIIPNGVIKIEDFVFEGFEKLENIVFPDSLQIIGHRAFEGCISLKEVSFPKSLISIDFRSFDDCENLEVIEIYAQTPPEITSPSADCWKFFGDAKNVTLYVLEESLNEYKKAFGWKDFKNIKILRKV